MGVSPDLLQSENLTQVGRVVERDVPLLIERWRAQAVASQPNARRLHHQALQDDLPRFLTELGRCLAESEERNAGLHCKPAQDHGEQRWEAGWSLVEVVRDYQILRLILTDHLEEALERPLNGRELAVIGLCLDDAIGVSVASYVANREEYQRGLEKQRAEQDRRLQEELERREGVLRQADRHKNEFLATLAHELRNPLAPLRNIAGVLELHETTDPVVLQVKEIVQRQVQQMARLVDDLADVSRIAQGKIELSKERVELARVVEQAVQTIEPVMAARKHKLEVNVPAEALALAGDPARLAQVLLNLLNNAAKYTDPGGQIRLEVEKRDGRAVVRVRDDGIGIDAGDLPHIFELFSQAEWSLGRAQGGLGIGLALVRRLVDLHGGTIAAQSAGRNQGSEFTVQLPLMTDAPPVP